VKSKYGLVAAVVCATLAAASWSRPARAESAPKESEKSDDSRGIHIGALAGVGFPRPLAVEGVFDVDHLLLVGAEYSALPQISVAGGQTSMWAIAGDARIFPARKGFFIGLRVGRQHLDESATVTVVGVGSASGSMSADTTFINPRLGFLWNFGAFAMGIDAGVQIPVGVSTSESIPAGITAPQAALDVRHTLAQSPLPTVDLLRLGLIL
jgi:hypothetical protein